MTAKRTTKQQIMASQLLPNTFPFANVLMDELPQLNGSNIWSLLEPAERTLLPVIYRKTFGWWKKSDRIAMSQLKQMTGMNDATIRKYMESLVQIGLVVRVDGNNTQNEGIEWSPQTDDSFIAFSFLLERAENKSARDNQRMERIRSRKGVLLSDKGTIIAQDTPPIIAKDAPPIIAQRTQKPIKPELKPAPVFRDPVWDLLHGKDVSPEQAQRLEQERIAIEDFESAFELKRPWNWYPDSGSSVKTWADFREFVVELHGKDATCFVKYVTWSRQPFVKGSMNALSIKRNPELFPDSWSAYCLSPQYAELNQVEQDNDNDDTLNIRVV